MRRNNIWSDFATNGNAIDPQQVSRTIVRLHQRTDSIVLSVFDDDARGRPGAPFEFVANHACAAANVALINRAPTDRAVERSECVLLRQSECFECR